MVIQVVRVAIRPEQRARWLELLRANAVQTRAEKGCERYLINEDIEVPNTFTIVEWWTTMEAQLNHFRNPEFGKLMSVLGDIVAGPPEVSINEVSSSQTLDEALKSAGVGQ